MKEDEFLVFLEENQVATEFIFNTERELTQEEATVFRLATQAFLTSQGILLLDFQAMGYIYPSDSPQFSFFENDVVYELDYEYMFHFIIGVDSEEHTPVVKRLLELGLEDVNVEYKYIDCKLIEPRGE